MSLKEEIYELVKTRNHVSFAEIKREVPGAEGDFSQGFADYNVYYAFGFSEECLRSVEQLIEEKLVKLSICSPMIYHIDGIVPNYPVAKTHRKYKKEHWLPVVLELVETGG
jgi:hypothetical protein